MSGGEGLMLGLAIAAGVFLFIAFMSRAVGTYTPPPLLPPLLPPPPYLTAAEANALAQASAIGLPVDFYQPSAMHNGAPALFRATPTGAGHGYITQLPAAHTMPGQIIKQI
jgi:hypothetical protein